MKKTQIEMLNEILEAYDLTDEHEEFIKSRIEQLENRKSNSNAVSEQALAEIAMVKDLFSSGDKYTALDISKHCGFDTTQKASGILNKISRYNAKGELVHPDSNIVYETIKGKKYFYAE